MVYELMTPADTAQVAQLEAMCFSAPWSEKAIVSELTNPLSLWLVAKENNVVAGYVGSHSVMGEADMMNLAVHPDYRKNGIARALVSCLVERLAANMVCSLTLEVRASNEAAKNLYASMGFQQVGRRPNYYTAPKEDALILRKEWNL